VKNDEIFQKIEENCHVNSYNINHKTVLRHLQIGKELDVRMPHLTLKILMDRIFICESLETKQIEPFLKRLITGDEK